jgi:hypothetical protein|uniref:DUF962 domain-containing protein n=1 Tax=uncultured marine virus TaxID=186617 RepID=A0A0F7L9Y2_9VIRU|nr:hypothetical protein [uncultured marine virus]
MKFDKYYEHYLSLHQNLWCRRLHVIGQVATLLYISFIFYSGYWWALLLTPFIIYPFAWSGHYFFEKNEPAAFSNPWKAKAADWVMLFQWIKGEIKR